MKFHRLVDLQGEKVCRIAVLPFTNEINSTKGGVSVYRIFTSELAEKDNFELVQEGDIRHVYRQIKLVPFQSKPNIEQLQVIGNYLNTKYLIEGKILDMEVSSQNSGSGNLLPFLTMELRLIDASNGKTIWTTYHRKSGEDYRTVMHFGMVNTTTQLASLMSQEILERWTSEGFIAQCTE